MNQRVNRHIKQHSKQRGAAILLAMLVVTLVATLAAGLQWRQWRAYSQEAAQRTQAQAAWVLVGALDWARLILREDARSGTNNNEPLVDHLGEPWAIPLQEAKLSTFLAADSLAQAGQDEAYLSGSITDAQSKINVTNLSVNGVIDKPTLTALSKLYAQLQLPAPELAQWSEAWRLSDPQLAVPANLPAAAAPAFGTSTTPLRPSRINELAWLGLSTSSLNALRPYLTVLPERTAVNLNTAPVLVVYAVVPAIDVAKAQHAVSVRAQTPFKNIDLASQALGGASLGGGQHAVNSQYFEVRGRLRLGDWLLDESSLVQRRGLEVRTLWRQRGTL